MGTRNLTAVWLDGQWKVAQYGQWDGYPGGQGRTVLNFLHMIRLDRFAEKVRGCRFATPEELKEIYSLYSNPDGSMTIEQADRFKASRFGYLSRDTGARILWEIAHSDGGLLLKDSHTFAADSLFCEWAYVIDFDQRTFEVYKGFITEPHTGQRFSDVEDPEDRSYRSTEYFPISLVKTYNLDDLPAFEQFVTDVDPPEEDEEAEA